MTTTLTPNLMTDNVNETVAFYCDRLGFRFQMGLPFDTEIPVGEFSTDTPLQFAMLNRDSAMLMLQERGSLAGECVAFKDMPVGASTVYYLEVDDLDALIAGLNQGVERVVPERTTFYGMREVWIRDNNGYVVAVAQRNA